MRRLAWLVTIVALGAGPILMAAEADPSALEAQKKELAAKKKSLQAEQGKIRGEIARSDALAAPRKAVADAQKALQEKVAGGPAVVKARQAEKAAQAKLQALVAAKAGASSGQAAASKDLEALDAKRADLEFRAGLVDLELKHPGSPVRQKVEADPEVKMLQEAVDAAEQKIEDQPSPEAAKALQESRAAAETLAAAEAEAMKDAACRKAADAVQAATAARAKALADDKRPEAARQARQAHEDARTRAYLAIPQAKPLVEELGKTGADLEKVEQALDSSDAVLAVYRQMLASGGDPDTAAVRARLAAAQAALDKAMKDSGLADMAGKFKSAQKSRDDRCDLLLTMNAEFRNLTNEERNLAGRERALASRLDRLSDKEVKELAEVRARQAAVTKQLRQMRQSKWHDPAVEGLWKTADGLYHGLAAKRRTTAAVAEAQQGLQAAERRQVFVLDRKAAADPRSRWAVQEQRDLLAKEAALAFRKAVLQYKLGAPKSALAARVDGDAAVIRARKAWQDIEANIKANPTPAVAAADRELARARADQEAALAKQKGHAEAAAKAKEAMLAARKTAAADPRRKAVAEMEKVLQDRIASKTQGLPEAQDLLKQRAAIEQELAQLGQSRADAARKAGDLRKAVQIGEDPQVVAARKAVEDASKAAKEAEAADTFAPARASVEAAQKALKDATDAAVAADPRVLALQKQIDDLDAKAKEVDSQLRAARQKPKAEKPAKDAAPKKASKKAPKEAPK
jgi:hypothetical protein